MSVFFNEARGRWQYDFQRGGKRHAGYCVDDAGHPVTSRRAALDAEARAKAAAGKPADAAPARSAPGGFTFAEAVADWSDKVGRHNRSWDAVKKQVRELVAYFGAGTPCVDITEARIDDYIAWQRKQPVTINVGGPRSGGKTKKLDRLRSVATINRHLSALRAILRRAHRLRYTPTLVLVPRLREMNDAPNPIRREDLAELLRVAPKHVRRALLLSTHTGMRLTECLGLTWRQVDMAGRSVTLGRTTKAGKGRVIPLNEVALSVLEDIRREPLHPSGRVILFQHYGRGPSRPVASIKRAWATALRSCGWPKRYRYHDSRAAFCSYLAELGIDAIHVKELAGHASITTTLRYIRPAESRLRKAVDLLAGPPPG